jgi:hypothetical protein
MQMSLNAIDWRTVATVNKDNSQKDEIVFPKLLETKIRPFPRRHRALSLWLFL